MAKKVVLPTRHVKIHHFCALNKRLPVVRTVVKHQIKGFKLAFANTHNPLKPRYFGHFQLRSFDIKAIVSTWHESTK